MRAANAGTSSMHLGLDLCCYCVRHRCWCPGKGGRVVPSRRGSCCIQNQLKLAMLHGAAAGVGCELTFGICGCAHVWRVLQLVMDA